MDRARLRHAFLQHSDFAPINTRHWTCAVAEGDEQGFAQLDQVSCRRGTDYGSKGQSPEHEGNADMRPTNGMCMRIDLAAVCDDARCRASVSAVRDLTWQVIGQNEAILEQMRTVIARLEN